MVCFDLDIRTRAALQTDGEPDQFVTGYDARIRAYDEDGGVKTVGRLVARRVQAEAAFAHGEQLFDVCDGHSHELHVLHTLLYEPDGYEFRPALGRRFEPIGWDLLALDDVILHPKWRGLRLGLLAVRRFIDVVGGGCGLVAAEVYPLRREAHEALRVPEHWLPANAGPGEGDAAAVGLRRYFRRMGFRRVGRTPVYALSLTRKAPTAADLLSASWDAGK